jgi:hypothetical protein
MNDREFLIWLHARLVTVHGEDQLLDYMRKLRAIIRATPKDKLTPNVERCNSLAELEAELKNTQVLTFEQEVRAQFSGEENAGIRRVLRETHNSREIRLIAKSIAFTELGRAKLEIVAEAVDRPVRK